MCECIIWGSIQLGCKFAKVHWKCVLCVGQPSAISMDAIYIKSSLKRPLLAHCNYFHHVGYDRGPRPTPYYNDKHEQIKFILNTINFKVPIFITFNLHSFNSFFCALALKLKLSFNFSSTPHAYQIWSCQAKLGAWLLPNPKHWDDSIGPIQGCHLFLCLQEMWKHVPKDVVLFDTREFFWLYVQGLILAQFFHLNLSII